MPRTTEAEATLIDLKLHAIRTQAGLTTEKLTTLDPDASAWLGARVFEWLEIPQLQGMSEERRWYACMAFHGVACIHPHHMRDYCSSDVRCKDFVCRACGTGVARIPEHLQRKRPH